MDPTASAPALPAGGLEAAVGAAVDQIKSFRLRIWAPVLLGIVMLFDTWDSSVVSYVMPSLVAQWHLKPVVIGFLISSGFAGQFIGALTLGTLAERFGRMPVFLVAMTGVSVFAILCALTQDYRSLMAVRFVQGIMIGGSIPVVITYINELAPAHARGRYFAIFQFFNQWGSLAAAFSSVVIIPTLGWHVMFGLGAMPVLLLPLVIMTLPESPRWLARAGRIAKLNAALVQLGGQAITDADTIANTKAVNVPRTPLSALFAPEFRRRTIVALSLWFLTPLVGFGLATWAPSIYVTVFHVPIQTALSYSSAGILFFVLSMPLVAIIIDRVGRRRLGMTLACVAMTALFCIPIIGASRPIFVVALVVLGQVTTYDITLTLWSYSAEIYPTRVRAMALGLLSSFARGASMLSPAIVGGILAVTGSVMPIFILFGLCCLTVMLLWIFCTRETARKSLEEI